MIVQEKTQDQQIKGSNTTHEPVKIQKGISNIFSKELNTKRIDFNLEEEIEITDTATSRTEQCKNNTKENDYDYNDQYNQTEYNFGQMISETLDKEKTQKKYIPVIRCLE